VTWSISRALHKISQARRLEDEAIISAPSVFHSAGRRDLKFWGEDDGPTVVVWKVYRILSRNSGRKRWASRRIGWFDAGREKQTKSNACLKLIEEKSFQTATSKQSRRKDE